MEKPSIAKPPDHNKKAAQACKGPKVAGVTGRLDHFAEDKWRKIEQTVYGIKTAAKQYYRYPDAFQCRVWTPLHEAKNCASCQPETQCT
jgi:hypothetical protein